MSGPPPKPTELKLLAGNPGEKKLNDREPKPRHITPRCPAWLNADQKTFWRELAPMLARLRVMTEADRHGLASLCIQLALIKHVQQKLKEFGVVVKTPNGYPVVSPYISIQNNAVAQATRLMQEFGLTPASRSRIFAGKLDGNSGRGKKEGDDEKTSVFGRRRA